jgi:hypothetical protein
VKLNNIARLFRSMTSAVVVAAAFGLGAEAQAAPLIPGDLLVLDTDNGFGAGKVIEVDPHTGAQTIWASGGYLDQPTAMAFDGKGNLIVTDFENGYSSAIIRINTTTSQQTEISKGGNLVGTVDLAIESAGTYLTLSQHPITYPMSPSIDRINPTTGAQTLVVYAEAWSGSPLSLPQHMVLTPDGNILVSNAEYEDGVTGIFKVNATTGAVSTVATGGIFSSSGGPDGLLLNPTNPNQLYMTVNDLGTPSIDGLYVLNLITGAETAISTGGLLLSSGPVTEGASGDLLVLSKSGVVDVNPTTGVQTLLVSGSSFITPSNVLLIPTPEPATAGLFALGLAGLAVVGGRRLRNRGA